MSIGLGSARKLPFKCRCGRIIDVRIANVVRGQKRCGRCNNVLLESGSGFGNLTYVGETTDIGRGSNRKLPFKCRCGKLKRIRAKYVLSGKSKDCGRCSEVNLKTGDRYHGFTFVGPNTVVLANSPRKLPFRCSCGNVGTRSIRTVTSGLAKSCGKCGMIRLSPGQRYFAFTYAGDPVNISPGSKRKLPFKCQCGTTKLIQMGSVTRGDSTRCGSCHAPATSWYEKNKERIREIRCPADPNSFPEGGVAPTGTVLNTFEPFEAICPACGETYHPYLHCIKRGISLTCGCTNDRVSKMNRQMAEFIRGLGVDPMCEFELDGRYYDVAVPDKKLLIELHGLRWHAGREAHRRDFKKFTAAREAGYDVIVIFEDEWRNKRRIMESLVSYRLGRVHPVRLRPGSCDIEFVNFRQASVLYDEFHYIGRGTAFRHCGVIFQGKTIGCASFRKPTRHQCDGDFEISRMVMDPRYLVNGIWSKVMKTFVSDVGPRSVISFSDNRLFSGRTCGRMGFRMDGLVKPDYYWTKNGRRFHKSAMRKPRGYDGTEKSLWESQGFHQVWDYGKTRWRWTAEA